MNALVKEGDRRMTVREVADALGVSVRVIQKWASELYPDSVKNGMATFLDELQVTRIKQRIMDTNGHLARSCEVAPDARMPPTTAVVAAKTDLEMIEKTAEVIAWAMAKIEAQKAELAAAAPKLESHEALMRSEQTMSITDAAKHFGLHPKTHVFPYLREREYLTKDDMPSQDAIDAGYLALRETKCPDGTVRKQAVVLVSQLETWRTRVVPQVNRWAIEGVMA